MIKLFYIVSGFVLLIFCIVSYRASQGYAGIGWWLPTCLLVFCTGVLAIIEAIKKK